MREQEARAEARRQAGIRRAVLARRIREEGEAPEGMHVVEGRTILSTQTIYGGGELKRR